MSIGFWDGSVNKNIEVIVNNFIVSYKIVTERKK